MRDVVSLEVNSPLPSQPGMRSDGNPGAQPGQEPKSTRKRTGRQRLTLHLELERPVSRWNFRERADYPQPGSSALGCRRLDCARKSVCKGGMPWYCGTSKGVTHLSRRVCEYFHYWCDQIWAIGTTKHYEHRAGESLKPVREYAGSAIQAEVAVQRVFGVGDVLKDPGLPV
jgi:hypothetical protein